MSKKLYCIAQFTPKKGRETELFNKLKQLEPDTLREDGCISYRVTKHIKSPFAEGQSMPFVFIETWESIAAFEKHCQKEDLVKFFEQEISADNGSVESHNITVSSDE